MISLKASRILVALTLGAGALASSFLAASPASAASCARDPYTHACVRTATYHVTARMSRVAVQRTPYAHNTTRSLRRHARVQVICQINNGGGNGSRGNHTWDALAGGGWVYDAYLSTPRVARNGFSPGIRHCGATNPVGKPVSAPIGNPAPTPVSAPAPVSPPAPVNSGPAPVPTPEPAKLDPAAYPWPQQDGWAGDGHGYYQGECVSFAAWAVRADSIPDTRSPDRLGNANQWTGASVDATPQVGDVAQWDGGRNGAGSVGHVAYVAAVNTDGSVTVWEYNWGNFHRFNTRTIPASDPSRYLHF